MVMSMSLQESVYGISNFTPPLLASRPMCPVPSLGPGFDILRRLTTHSGAGFRDLLLFKPDFPEGFGEESKKLTVFLIFLSLMLST